MARLYSQNGLNPPKDPWHASIQVMIHVNSPELSTDLLYGSPDLTGKMDF